MIFNLKSVCGVSLLLLLSSCGPDYRIADDMEDEVENFKKDLENGYVTESKLTTYDVGQNLNYLSNDTIRELALTYANYKALDYRRSSNRYNSDDHYAGLAEDAKENLLNYKGTNVRILKGGIWALHKIYYGVYGMMNSTYSRSFLYLYSEDGKKVLWSNEVDFDEGLLSDILSKTNTSIVNNSYHDIYNDGYH